MKITKMNLKKCLKNAVAQLNRGEKVPVEFNEEIHDHYLNLKSHGLFQDLMCIKTKNNYFLARVR